MFYEIAASGDLRLLLIGGEFKELEAQIAWEELVRDNCKATNNRKFMQFMDAKRQYIKLINDQMFVKVALEKLHFEVDHDLVGELKRMGFKVFTDLSHSNVSEKYAESLKRCEIQSQSFNTRIKVQENYIAKLQKDEETSAKHKGNSMQATLVRVGAALNMVLPQDILLCSFNEYCNILKERKVA